MAVITADTARPRDEQRGSGSPTDDPGLFAWQREALAAWQANDRIGVVQAVTGAGKTRVGLAAIAQARETGRRCVVIVPTRELVRQWVRQVQRTFPRDWVVDDARRPGWTIAVTTVHKLKDTPALAPGEHGLLVADECHRYGAETFALALRDEFDWRIGLSATFERDDSSYEQILLPYFHGICYDLGYGRARADNVIAPFRFAFASVPFKDHERTEYEHWSQTCRDTLLRLQLDHQVPFEPFAEIMPAVQRIADDHTHRGRFAAKKYLLAFSRRRRVLADTQMKQVALTLMAECVRDSHGAIIFTQTQASASQSAQLLAERGCPSAAIHSGLDDEERVVELQRFKDKQTKAISAPRILDEGVDVPAADLGVVMASNRSRRQMVQRLGRVLRRKEGGAPGRFVVFYVADTVEDPFSARGLPAFYGECLPHAEAVGRFNLDVFGIDDLLEFLAAPHTEAEPITSAEAVDQPRPVPESRRPVPRPPRASTAIPCPVPRPPQATPPTPRPVPRPPRTP